MELTYEQALEKAKALWDEVDYFIERENAFIFSKYDDTNIGGCGPVVVLKETGECLSMPTYICEGLITPTVAEGKI